MISSHTIIELGFKESLSLKPSDDPSLLGTPSK